jgi:hypothetical protein
VVRRFLVAWDKTTSHIYGPEFEQVVLWFGKQNGLEPDVSRMASKYLGTKEDRAETPIKSMDVASRRSNSAS